MSESMGYYKDLEEIARGSEGGCTVFPFDNLTTSQKEAIKTAEAISGVLHGGEIVAEGFTITVIVRKDFPDAGEYGEKFVTVTRIEAAIDPASIY